MTLMYFYLLSKSDEKIDTDAKAIVTLLFTAFFMALDWRISGWFS